MQEENQKHSCKYLYDNKSILLNFLFIAIELRNESQTCQLTGPVNTNHTYQGMALFVSSEIRNTTEFQLVILTFQVKNVCNHQQHKLDRIHAKVVGVHVQLRALYLQEYIASVTFWKYIMFVFLKIIWTSSFYTNLLPVTVLLYSSSSRHLI